MNKRERLRRSFYEHERVTDIAEALIGKSLVTSLNGIVTSGVITETEAYCGRGDMACHANDGLRTKRTEIMYHAGGAAYVYLCYGIHHLFNVVTNKQELADAVLIRSILPETGADLMERRYGKKLNRKLQWNGPGRMTKALGIDMRYNKSDLLSSSELWIEQGSHSSFEVEASARIGIDYAGEDALLPWRFTMKKSSKLSKSRF